MTTPVLTTACALDCPDSCSLDVQVENGRVSKIDGNRRNSVTEGYICSKVRRFSRHIYGEQRLATPMRRQGAKGSGDFQEISWDEALTELSAQIRHTTQSYGGEAIVPFSYGGSNGLLTQDTLDARLWRRLGASRLARTVCAAATTAAAVGLYGKMPGVAYEDYRAARLIVVWGANPSASGIHLVPQILRAQKDGAKLVVIDPRRTNLAKKADLYLPVRPGSDVALALAVIHWLFENDHADLEFLGQHTHDSETLRQRAAAWNLERAAETCGLDAQSIESFARLYAETSPAVIRCGWGQERNRNGGSATAAILALPAVGGKFGVRGGGYTASNSGAWPFDTQTIIGAEQKPTREINMNRLGRDLLEGTPPIHLLFVYNSNPLATLPRQDLVRRGLEREDLYTVVFEQVMTDSARYADLLLPATTFLEHQDLRAAYGVYALQTVKPIIDPVGEARSNPEVFEQLLHRLDLEQPGDIPAAEVFKHMIHSGGLNDEQRARLQQDGLTEPGFGRRPVQFVDVFPRTDDHKIHLVPKHLDEQAPRGLYAFQPDPATEKEPLALVSPATNKTVSSTLGQLHEGPISVVMNPQDATVRGLTSGDEVRIHNSFGELRTTVKISRDVRPGVTELPKGMWDHQTLSGVTGNTLVPDSYTDLGEGACFNDTRVEIEAASS